MKMRGLQVNNLCNPRNALLDLYVRRIKVPLIETLRPLSTQWREDILTLQSVLKLAVAVAP